MRIRTMAAAVFLLVAIDAGAQGYPVPSFDCANTTTPQELRICRSPQLSELDGRHGALVERAVRWAEDRDKAVAEMDAWLERVRNPCQTDECLADAYTQHIAELERTLPPPKPQPAFTMPASKAPPAQSVNAAPARVAPGPEPRSDDDEDEDDDNGGRDYMIAAAIALLAVVVAAAMRAGLRKRPRR